MSIQPADPKGLELLPSNPRTMLEMLFNSSTAMTGKGERWKFEKTDTPAALAQEDMGGEEEAMAAAVTVCEEVDSLDVGDMAAVALGDTAEEEATEVDMAVVLVVLVVVAAAAVVAAVEVTTPLRRNLLRLTPSPILQHPGVREAL